MMCWCERCQAYAHALFVENCTPSAPCWKREEQWFAVIVNEPRAFVKLKMDK